jgi:pyridoxamine 5'-phosphate oxidase
MKTDWSQVLEQLRKNNNPQLLHDAAWQLMQESTSSHKMEMHQFFLATSANNAPDVRTVILRKVDILQRKIRIHSDVRSSKIIAIQNNTQVSAVLYDHSNRLQIRLCGIASVHHTCSVANEAWANSQLSSQLHYSNIEPSGTPILEPQQLLINDKNPSQETLHFCRNNFCVINIEVQSADIMQLHYTNNRRMMALYENEQEPEMTWISC